MVSRSSRPVWRASRAGERAPLSGPGQTPFISPRPEARQVGSGGRAVPLPALLGQMLVDPDQFVFGCEFNLDTPSRTASNDPDARPEHQLQSVFCGPCVHIGAAEA